MLTRIQIRSTGPTANDVEHELHGASSEIIRALELEGSLADQVIEGTPGSRFDGRITLTVTDQGASEWQA